MLRFHSQADISSPAQLAARVDRITAELKVYKDMANYYQTQITRLTQGNASEEKSAGTAVPAVVSQATSTNSSTIASSASLPDVSSPHSDQTFSTDGTAVIVPTKEFATQLLRAYDASLRVVLRRELLVQVSMVGLEQKLATLMNPIVFRDNRAPEDVTGEIGVVTNEDTPLETLVELWEHALVFQGGTTMLGRDNHPLNQILSDNVERLMHVVIFQREAHSVERFAERLVKALAAMASYYRRYAKIGAATSVLTIARQVITSFPAMIPPTLSDSVYTLLLLNASTEAERKEWLNMLHDQINFTTTSLVAFNISFILSKLRANPVLSSEVYTEIMARIQELESLIPVLKIDFPLFIVWRRLLIACFHAEANARIGDMHLAAKSVAYVEQLFKENYTSYLSVSLLNELQNFRDHCSPCSVLINGRQQPLVQYVIERVEAIDLEMASSAPDTPSSHDAHPQHTDFLAQQMTSSYPPFAQSSIPPVSHMDQASIAPTQVPIIQSVPGLSGPNPVATPANSTLFEPVAVTQPPVDELFTQLPDEENKILDSWSTTANKLNTELFHSQNTFDHDWPPY